MRALSGRRNIIPDRGPGTCFRTNRSCRQGPAHQGMEKSGCWLAGLPYGDSELGSATDLPAAGDKPQPYNVLFRLETKSQLEEVSSSGHFRTDDKWRGGNTSAGAMEWETLKAA